MGKATAKDGATSNASKSDGLLSEIARKLKAGEEVQTSTPRILLGWFDSSRRGRKRVIQVAEGLASHGLSTTPPLTQTYIDGTLTFELLPNVGATTPKAGKASAKAGEGPQNESEAETSAAGERDRISGYAVRRLKSANTPLISVKPNTPLKTVVTVMLTNDISQVPVMQSEYDLKGVIRWSSLGARLALGQVPTDAKDCMEPPSQIRAADDIFAVVDRITQHEYALVQEEDRRFTGIVTTSDLSEILHVWAEPFLLLGEIENRVRSLIGPKFSAEELKSLVKESGEEIESVEDLTFGDYVRLLQATENWERLEIPLEKTEFIRHMEEVRTIRNDVMHFDPDRTDDNEGDSDQLKKFLKLLQQLRDMGLC